MLTVLTWLWAQPGGRATYTAAHVNIWAAMVRRRLRMPHRIACVTDMPAGIDPSIAIIPPPRDFEDARIPTWGPDRPQCLRRLAMFRRDAGAIFGERFVCMDLDVAIGGPLDPLFDVPDDFRIFRGTTANRPYNGSMMLLTAGARPQVYEKFTLSGAVAAGRRYVGSDQAWISQTLRGEATWGPEHGVIWLNGRLPRDPAFSVVFFPGTTKPWQLVDTGQERWVLEHYRADVRDRPALILGFAPTVWKDLDGALAEGPFGGVIASPEAARHWPGEVLAVANDDAHALRLARMHGFERTVVCGRTEGRAAA